MNDKTDSEEQRITLIKNEIEKDFEICIDMDFSSSQQFGMKIDISKIYIIE